MSRTKQTMDGNQAAAHVAYAYSEIAAIYPITPSSPMAELVDEWAGSGRQNIFGQTMSVCEMQSESGAAGAVHGALITGSLATTFTSSQGLLLMLPNLYRIAGEFLPGVFHVAARTIATHALSIFGDHSDIYACRQTGVAMLATGSVQEVMDISPIAHLAAITGRIPFLHFFDGFRTSHELHKIEVWDYQDLASLYDTISLERFRRTCLHPSHNKIMGSAQNPDIFFQAREAGNSFYEELPQIVDGYFQKINELLDTDYGLFNYYGAADATHVIVAMGSVCETIREYLAANPDLPYGLVAVHLYRPFSREHLLSVLPPTVTQLTMLSRTKEPGAPGEPLYTDVVAALQDSPFQGIRFCSGRYGLSSKDTTPSQIAAVYANHEIRHFTVGIIDDVTNLSLPLPDIGETAPTDTISCKFWGLGGDGTVSATKNIVKIVGDYTDLQVQGYFEYDSKKSRGLTISHLRFAKNAIHSAYLVQSADFVACQNPVYLHKYDMVEDLKDGGSFLLNCYFEEKDLDDYIPDKVKAYIAAHNIHLFLIDAIRIGKEIGLNNKISTILQAAFFAVSEILPVERAEELMKAAARKSYGDKGDKIIAMNDAAIERGLRDVRQVEIPSSWHELALAQTAAPLRQDNPLLPGNPELLSFVENIQHPVTAQHGNELPVSAFLPYADGSFPPGSTAHERRNTATEIPVWKPENCIQCNRCSFVCPHAVIRPAVMTAEELGNAPKGMKSLPMAAMADYAFSIIISDVDCTGCGACAGVCPGKQGNTALVMCPINEHQESQQYFEYGKDFTQNTAALSKFKTDTVKGSQFKRPLMEFSGACAGCGETPYVKLLTQLFGSDMYIANATGCSSIWANSTPSTAYTADSTGHGPAWSNSLFEDGAEFGFGMLMTQEHRGTAPIQWVIGGDGWAYDIGFGGLDHILASGRNINVLVLDTEVYSNTGGQASKATPMGSTAKFITGGKKGSKKDLCAMAMTYGHVYVAQIALGADYNQTVKALTEAAAYDGPSLVVAYSTCIAHGIRAGLGSSCHEEKKAVDAGYFHLFRFHPALKKEGKNPFSLDSKAPSLTYDEFLEGELRYDILKRLHPDEAQTLFEQASQKAAERYRYLQKLAALYEPDSI